MMESFIDFLFFAFIAIVLGGTALMLVAEYQDYITPDDYVYVDLDGNTGFADVCSSDKAVLRCKVGSKQITVKEYHIREEEE